MFYSHGLFPKTKRVLKFIWYRMNKFNDSKNLPGFQMYVEYPNRLATQTFYDPYLGWLYFTWVIQVRRIEINIYLTGKINEDEMNNIIVRAFFFTIATFLNTMGLIVLFLFHF